VRVYAGSTRSRASARIRARCASPARSLEDRVKSLQQLPIILTQHQAEEIEALLRNERGT
jgi:hypothetical protein